MTPTFPTNQDLDPTRLRQAFGVFPTGVVAVAARVDGQTIGLAASSFSSVSLEPPLVSVSIARTSKTWGALRRARRLGVTVLAEHHGAFARQLAGTVEHRFDGIGTQTTPLGSVTIDDGLASFDTTIYSEVDAGDHIIVLLQLHAVGHDANDVDVGPLVFHRSGFDRLSGGAGKPSVAPAPAAADQG